MAKRWSFEEDYLVCKFSFAHIYMIYSEEEFGDLILNLKERGFTDRSKGSLERRIREYQNIFTGYETAYTSEQVKSIASAYISRTEDPERFEKIQACINEAFASNYDNLSDNISFGLQNQQLNHFVEIDPAAPSFKDLLRFYIRKSGMTDAQVYRASFVSRDKFNHIINGRKGKKIKESDNSNKCSVSPRTVMQLCIGLKLSYADAAYLMACAGYAFQPNEDIDRVVVACLKYGVRNIVEVNIELDERGLELFKEPIWRSASKQKSK